MKKVFVLLALFLLCAYGAEKVPRRAVVSKEMEQIAEFEIVRGEKIPVLDWACHVLQESLKTATGFDASVVDAPSGSKMAIIVGDCDESRKAGIDVGKLPEEGYVILRKGGKLFLAGRDSKTDDPKKNVWMQRYKRASLSATYDFLERFAGARFVFPGEYGTVIPERKALFLPKEIDILERPDFSVRTLHVTNAKNTSRGAFDKIDGVMYTNQVILSGRWSEFAIPFIHGLAHIDLVERFKDTHPEYFALMPDGKRHCFAATNHFGHICFSNKELRDVIYEDIKAFLTGRPAKERGIKWWRGSALNGKYASVMPHDSFYWCCCDECAKIAKGAGFCHSGLPIEERQKAAAAINDVIWKFTKEMAERLTKDGIDGSVTQMAYHPSKEPPDFKLPENIEIQVATPGLGNRRHWENDRALLQRWKDKTGKSLSVWTYPGKHMGKAAMRGIPAMMHHQMGEYFQFLGDNCCGAFIEEETDYIIFNFLNDYVFSHVAWNNSTDVNELLDDAYAALFGAGAAPMKKYFDTLEHLWCDRIIGNSVDTEKGPVYTLPTVYDVWLNIYSKKQMAEFDKLFDEAEFLAANDKGAVGRIKYIREHFHGIIAEAKQRQQMEYGGYKEWTITPGEKAWLHHRFWKKTEVRTWATVNDDGDDLVVSWHCEEPKVKNMVAEAPADVLDGAPYLDSDVEFFINPSGDRKNFYQFAVNSKGALYDSHMIVSKSDTSWNSGAKVIPEIGEDYWKVIIRIPKKSLGELNKDGVPMNFARHRVLNENGRESVEDYQWTLTSDNGFSDISAWGSLVWKAKVNLLANADFEQVNEKGMPLNWNIWREEKDNPEVKVTLDTKEFLTGGQSLRFDKPLSGRILANQKYKGKPNTKYRLSFYVKTENVVPGQLHVGAGSWIQAGKKVMPYPNPRVHGTTEWIRQATDFETDDGGAYSIGLWNWYSSGTAWFDHVVLEEIGDVKK